MTADPYATPRPTLDTPAHKPRAVNLDEANKLLDLIYCIAEDMAEGTKNKHTSYRGQYVRNGRRICNIIDQVDDALGLEPPEPVQVKPSDYCCLNFGCENPAVCDALGKPCGYPGTAEEWKGTE